MTYNIEDFDEGDRIQYFNDTYVQYSTKKGLKTGRIESFHSAGKVIVSDSVTRAVVNLRDIKWKGLVQSRCVIWCNYLAFVGPAGARSHKKPPTTRNTIALVYQGRRTPTLLGRGMRDGNINSDLLMAYLDDSTPYPEDMRSVRLLLDKGGSAIPLSPRAGISYDSREEKWHLIKDGVICTTSSEQSIILRESEEALNHGT